VRVRQHCATTEVGTGPRQAGVPPSARISSATPACIQPVRRGRHRLSRAVRREFCRRSGAGRRRNLTPAHTTFAAHLDAARKTPPTVLR
jgi:hypothetical protein